jgi:hypothetical protein
MVLNDKFNKKINNLTKKDKNIKNLFKKNNQDYKKVKK